MDILVAGGTGFIGSALCRELADREHDVTALARNPHASDLPENIEVVAGDVTDYETLPPVVEGQDVFVNLVALSPLYKPDGGNQMHDRVHRGGTENCVRAAEAAEVDQFVQLSGIHADPDAPTAYLRAKGRAEEIVQDSSLDWVILRPTVVFGEGGEFIPFTKKVAPPYLTPLPGGGRTRFHPIWLNDFTPMLADAADDNEHIGNIYELAGPEIYSLAEIARLVHQADGRSATIIPIPMPLAGIGMTIGGAIPGFPFGPDQYRSLQLDLVVEDNDIAAFGLTETDLTPLDEYLLNTKQ